MSEEAYKDSQGDDTPPPSTPHIRFGPLTSDALPDGHPLKATLAAREKYIEQAVMEREGIVQRFRTGLSDLMDGPDGIGLTEENWEEAVDMFRRLKNEIGDLHGDIRNLKVRKHIATAAIELLQWVDRDNPPCICGHHDSPEAHEADPKAVPAAEATPPSSDNQATDEASGN